MTSSANAGGCWWSCEISLQKARGRMMATWLSGVDPVEGRLTSGILLATLALV